jgi:hypothetical protein
MAVYSAVYIAVSSYGIITWDNTPFQLLFLNMTWSISFILGGQSAYNVGWIRSKYATATFVGGVMCFLMSILYIFHTL